jgi:RNA polymerase sigma factor (sigma-70 family)
MSAFDDEVGFLAFAREVTPLLLRLLNRLCPDGHDVEDTAAEALARALVHWSRIGAPDYGRAWVLRVAANLALDQQRARRRRLITPTPTRPSSVALDEGVVDRVILSEALSRLARRQREAIVLHYAADLSIAETAQIMRLSPGTARTHIDRGIGELRRILRREELEVLGVER